MLTKQRLCCVMLAEAADTRVSAHYIHGRIGNSSGRLPLFYTERRRLRKGDFIRIISPIPELRRSFWQ
ncbi:hypothetical protein ACMA1I_14835 [Pontibacter sp. 13R65]|uniref:hypothetical protein n=1 Tax=Pontibacter sp. 13R65 TaxID=3127458 RepID=UPI00301DE09B